HHVCHRSFPTRRSSDLVSQPIRWRGTYRHPRKAISVNDRPGGTYSVIIIPFWRVICPEAEAGKLLFIEAVDPRNGASADIDAIRSEEHTSELQSRENLV